MCSRKWMVLAACALVAVAGAAARPGDASVVEAEQKPTSNEISSADAHAKPEDAKPNDAENTINEDKPEATKEVVAEASTEPAQPEPSTEPARAELQESPADKPVNEQYPHAVLFGGTCGGSIISPTWVLTAGHCTLFSGGQYVLAGTNNTADYDRGVRVHVKRLVIHPKFSVGPYWLDADRFNISQVAANWDFLLAELEEPLPLDGKVMAAAQLDDGPSVPDHLDAGYAGFGTATHGDVMRDDMHGMELRVEPDGECRAQLEQYEPEAMLCTRGRPPRFDSACNGDSGSGLVAGGKLYGVASWVQDDARRCFNGALVVFSRVAAARPWIRQVTGI